MLKLTIPSPCHEDWNKMTPASQGRHCTSCAKTVVDFTSMTDEQIKNYLIDRQSERICGRFKATQLHKIRIELPQNIFNIHMPSWKRFLVASLLVFSTTLFSCETTVSGKIAIPHNDTTIIYTGDTPPPPPPAIYGEEEIVGALVLPVPDSMWKHGEVMTDDVTGQMVMEPVEPEKIPVIDPAYLQTIKGDIIRVTDTIFTVTDTSVIDDPDSP